MRRPVMLPGHLLGTLLACALVDRVRPLKPRDWHLALVFGVAVDLDHFMGLPAYLSQNGVAAILDPFAMLSFGNAWRGFMHDPIAGGVVVLAATVATRSAIPGAFWGLHLFQDFVVGRHVAWGSAEEWALTAALLAATAGAFALDHARAGRGRSFLRHVAERLGLVAPPPGAAS